MKAALGNLVVAYLVVGGLLSGIMMFSYAWGSSGIALFYPSIYFSSVLRTVTWGPSLAVWFVAPQGYSFGKWLAPGFYAERIDPGAPRPSKP
jgi:hypothetical protein